MFVSVDQFMVWWVRSSGNSSLFIYMGILQLVTFFFVITFCCLYSQRVQKNEIFVDLLERLTVLVASNGNILRSHLDGSLIMRSFLGGHAGMYMYVLYMHGLASCLTICVFM